MQKNPIDQGIELEQRPQVPLPRERRNPIHLIGLPVLSQFIPYGLAIALFFVINALIPGYANLNSLLSLLLLSSLLGIASVGQTLTVIIGGFDLSIPAVIGFADVLLSLLYGAGWPLWIVIPFIFLCAIVIGLINGFASRSLQLNPLVVTLATGSILLGGIWAGTHGEVSGSVPDWIVNMVSVIGKTGPIPVPGSILLWLAVGIVVVLVERLTVLGRWIFAAGANARAAAMAGVPMLFVWMTVYAISAALAALTGILLAGFSGAADPTVGGTYLFTTVAAVVVGGTPLTGGRGSYARTIAGCLVVTELSTLLVGLGLDQAAQQVCLGLLIVVLVALYGREPHVSMRV
jgi:ribose transport system permease protein